MKELKPVTVFENLQNVKSAMVGFYRSGVDDATIGSIFGLSSQYVNLVLKRYFEDKKSPVTK